MFVFILAICGHCGRTVRRGLGVCWNCGSELPCRELPEVEPEAELVQLAA
jgi:predicted amidophosphoribosyltransferase